LELAAGDVLLVEGDMTFELGEHASEFALVRPVINSAPPRRTTARDATAMDRFRAWVCIVGLLALVVGSALGPTIVSVTTGLSFFAPVPVMAAALAFLLLSTKVLKYSDALTAIGGAAPTLILLAASFSVNAALVNSGVHATLAQQLARFCTLVSASTSAKVWLGTVLLAIITQVTTVVFPPTVCVVFVLQLGDYLSQELGISGRACALVVVFSANLCFAAPLANSIHVVCMEAGQYQRGRVAVIGLGMQIILTAVTIVGAHVHFPAHGHALSADQELAL